MNELERLIGQNVIAEIEIDDKIEFVEGKVTDINVNDFYFYEKREPIYITVSIYPKNKKYHKLDMDYFINIPIENIRKG